MIMLARKVVDRPIIRIHTSMVTITAGPRAGETHTVSYETGEFGDAMRALDFDITDLDNLDFIRTDVPVAVDVNV